MKSDQRIPLGTRIKEIRKTLRISQMNFASTLEMSNTYLSEIESNRGNPGYKFFYLICRKFNVNLNYLLTGTGEKFLNEEMRETIEYVQPDLENLESIESIGELSWLIKNSTVFKHSVYGFADKFLFENRSMILKSLKDSELQKK